MKERRKLVPIIASYEELSQRYDLSSVHLVPKRLLSIRPGQVITLKARELVGHKASFYDLPLNSVDFHEDFTLSRGQWTYEGIQKVGGGKWRSLYGKPIIGVGASVAILTQKKSGRRAAFLVGNLSK